MNPFNRTVNNEAMDIINTYPNRIKRLKEYRAAPSNQYAYPLIDSIIADLERELEETKRKHPNGCMKVIYRINLYNE